MSICWQETKMFTLELKLLIFCYIFKHYCHQIVDQTFILGYLTGSKRRPGNQEYARPGLTISGAISLAVDEINTYHPLFGNNSLAFVAAETYGDEAESIRQTAKLWAIENVAAYIGPQETCLYEARMAASFNLPMISYVSIEIY